MCIQSHLQWVPGMKQAGCRRWHYTSTLPYVFTAWSLSSEPCVSGLRILAVPS
jgi:hypothetical protein